MKPPIIICEIGCNHLGEEAVAVDMIQTAADFCAVDVVKFQKRAPMECLTPDQYAGPHPNPANSYGATYGEHREFLEFPVEVHARLQNACDEAGVEYSASVWDMTSAKEIASLQPALIKVPSGKNQHRPMLSWLAENYDGEIHVSLGMTTRDEEQSIYRLFDERGRLSDLVLYACTSGYPVPDEDVCLLEIPRLRHEFEGQIRGVGFSGHHLGIAIDMAAIALGAQWVERHFTMDRTWKGTDHAASLEPDGLRRLKRDSVSVANALQAKPREILEIEAPQREKLKVIP